MSFKLINHLEENKLFKVIDSVLLLELVLSCSLKVVLFFLGVETKPA